MFDLENGHKVKGQVQGFNLCGLCALFLNKKI